MSYKIFSQFKAIDTFFGQTEQEDSSYLLNSNNFLQITYHAYLFCLLVDFSFTRHASNILFI